MKLKIQITGGELIDCGEIYHYDAEHPGGMEITEDNLVESLANGGTFHCCSELNGGTMIAINSNEVICLVNGTLYMGK